VVVNVVIVCKPSSLHGMFHRPGSEVDKTTASPKAGVTRTRRVLTVAKGNLQWIKWKRVGAVCGNESLAP
jgi:hypothetical protein